MTLVVSGLLAITANGGAIVSVTYAYPGGNRFHFTDPSGTVLGVYCPS